MPRRASGMHAIQLEIDRSLYLDAHAATSRARASTRTVALLRDILDALADEACPLARGRRMT